MHVVPFHTCPILPVHNKHLHCLGVSHDFVYTSVFTQFGFDKLNDCCYNNYKLS